MQHKATKTRQSRKHIPYRPVFHGVIEGFTINTIRRYFPRLAPFHEFEDLLQDSWLVFLKCRQRFRSGLGPKAFMAFYSVCLHNKLRGRIERLPRYSLIQDVFDHIEMHPEHEQVSGADPFGYEAEAAVRGLPEFIQDVLQILIFQKGVTKDYRRAKQLSETLIRELIA